LRLRVAQLDERRRGWARQMRLQPSRQNIVDGFSRSHRHRFYKDRFAALRFRPALVERLGDVVDPLLFL